MQAKKHVTFPVMFPLMAFKGKVRKIAAYGILHPPEGGNGILVPGGNFGREEKLPRVGDLP